MKERFTKHLKAKLIHDGSFQRTAVNDVQIILKVLNALTP